MLGLVLDCPHQNPLHLGRERGINLPGPRILGEVENQQWIILWVGPGGQMKHGCAEAVNIDSRVRLSTEQFWRSVTHRAHGGDALFLFIYPACDSKIDQPNTAGDGLDVDVIGLDVPMEDLAGMQVMECARHFESNARALADMPPLGQR